MYIILLILGLFAILVYTILQLPVFGSLPTGARLERIKKLPNATEKGELKNLTLTLVKSANVTYWMIIKAMIKGNPNRIPTHVLPHIKPEMDSVSGTKVIWFGHSSYLLQVDAVKILVDPVFSPRTSPFSFLGNKNYPGTDFIKAEDFPQIDILLITHDHFDHLDYQTILKLKNKVGHFLTSAGVGAHLQRWGISEDKITELAWEEETTLCGFQFTATPARHFTGRTLKRNHTLWSSFVLKTPNHQLFLGGDSGYGAHFKAIGDKFGPFDLAILECGQYNPFWHDIHMLPEETVQAAKDLSAEVLLPVHWAKFTLALHDWDDSIIRVVKSSEAQSQKITTPLMGETIVVGENYPQTKWWLNTTSAKQ